MSSLQQQFEHMIVIKDRKGERIISLDAEIYTIGRSSISNIIIYDRDVSRCHATLVKQNSLKEAKTFFWLIDGNLNRNRSTNGLFVNKKLTLSRQLQIGDLISLGKKSTIKYYRFSRLALQKFSRLNKTLNEQILEKLLKDNKEYKKTVVN